jgi:hypothetical protein
MNTISNQNKKNKSMNKKMSYEDIDMEAVAAQSGVKDVTGADLEQLGALLKLPAGRFKKGDGADGADEDEDEDGFNLVLDPLGDLDEKEEEEEQGDVVQAEDVAEGPLTASLHSRGVMKNLSAYEIVRVLAHLKVRPRRFVVLGLVRPDDLDKRKSEQQQGPDDDVRALRKLLGGSAAGRHGGHHGRKQHRGQEMTHQHQQAGPNRNALKGVKGQGKQNGLKAKTTIHIHHYHPYQKAGGILKNREEQGGRRHCHESGRPDHGETQAGRRRRHQFGHRHGGQGGCHCHSGMRTGEEYAAHYGGPWMASVCRA